MKCSDEMGPANLYNKVHYKAAFPYNYMTMLCMQGTYFIDLLPRPACQLAFSIQALKLRVRRSGAAFH
jgi:hypothetical protein